MKTLPSVFLGAALATSLLSAANAQTPIPWPLGAPVPFTLQNNGTTPLSYQFCTPTVTDAAGQLVVWGLCTAAELSLPPGDTVTSWWHQHDAFGVQVAPGVYHVNGVPFAIGATDIGLRQLGSPHPGATRSITLTSPNDPNASYLLAASFSSNFGVPLGCGVTFPLDYDWLLLDSLTNPMMFPDFVGTLDGNGRSEAPAIVLPAIPALVGISFDLGFVTFVPSSPCGWTRASTALHVTIE